RKEGLYDCLTMTGNASFEDPAQKQRMSADRLKVWLEPKDTEAKEAGGNRQVRPHHVEAKGHVSASSPELQIQEPTDYLENWFQDVLEKPEESAAPSAVEEPLVKAPEPTAKPQEMEKPKQPLTLSARTVDVHVLRAGAKSELERLWCEGNVHVHQE